MDVNKNTLRIWLSKLGIAGALAAPLTLLFGYFGWPALPAAIVLTVAVTVAIHMSIAHHEKALTKRMAATESPLFVVTSDNRAGTISDVECAALELEVFRDGRTWLAQLLNIGLVALTLFNGFLATVPVVLFWCLVAMTLFWPEGFPTINTAVGGDWSLAARTMLRHAPVIFLLGAMANLILNDYRFGFINCFDRQMGRLLKARCTTAPDVHGAQSPIESTASA
jgi:hypothetical protein